MNIIAPCNRGWRTRTDDAIQLSRLAVQTCYWPLFEIDHGVTRVTYKPGKENPLPEFLRPQGRFRHLFAPENEWVLKKLEESVDGYWEELLRKRNLQRRKASRLAEAETRRPNHQQANRSAPGATSIWTGVTPAGSPSTCTAAVPLTDSRSALKYLMSRSIRCFPSTMAEAYRRRSILPPLCVMKTYRSGSPRAASGVI
ncbi:MAG: hypothetical protein MZV70_12525 [Desulfobacterales bacterium]|nr:hypothetical protein [Desulfobacterales bacterium]